MNKLNLFKHSHISERDFLKDYWHKKPLLIKNAINPMAFDVLPNKEQLMDLSCDDDIQSRIVFRHADDDYSVEYGPFEKNELQGLNSEVWNLLVSDIDKWQPKSQEILNYFSFIRNWVFDDIMLSCGSINGTVGPHTDHYDVFLIQVYGQRNWQFQYAQSKNPRLIPEQDLKIIADFQADEKHVLNPGDVLYLPPEIAHYGIALSEDCVTCSIGTRTPSHAELITSFVDQLAQKIDSNQRFNEPLFSQAQPKGEITSQDLSNIQAILMQRLNPEKHSISDWFGQYITEYRSLFYEFNQEQDLQDFNQNQDLYLDSFSKACYFQQKTYYDLFVNGQKYRASEKLAELICNHNHISNIDIKSLNSNDLKTLTLLFENGSVSHISSSQ